MASPSSSNFPAGDFAVAEENENAFQVSAAPVVPERNGTRRENGTDDLGLPRSYGMETLWLLPRDPHSLFAFWDIDWKAAFGEENPRPRQVHLRLLTEDGSEHTKVAVEPMAGQCSVRVEKADATYRGEIGFVDPAGVWRVVGRSAPVCVPPEFERALAPGDFATVPLHLSFQHMLDTTEETEGKNRLLTGVLSQLRQRATMSAGGAPLTAQQRDLVFAIEEAAARQPAPQPRSTATPDLWAHHRLERIFGFGNSSLGQGFGGSSR